MTSAGLLFSKSQPIPSKKHLCPWSVWLLRIHSSKTTEICTGLTPPSTQGDATLNGARNRVSWPESHPSFHTSCHPCKNGNHQPGEPCFCGSDACPRVTTEKERAFHEVRGQISSTRLRLPSPPRERERELRKQSQDAYKEIQTHWLPLLNSTSRTARDR